MKSGWARLRKICGPRFSRRREDQRAGAVADAEHLARDLLVAADDALGAAEVDDDVAELDALDDAGDDLADAVLELLILALALGVADLLEDDLLGGLGGDAAELDRRQRIDDEVADHGAWLQLLRVLEAHLLEIILDLLDHFDDAPQAQVAAVRIELGADVVLGAVAGAGGALDRVLHRLDDDHPVDQFLARDGVGDRDQLRLVRGDGARGAGSGGCGFGGHVFSPVLCVFTIFGDLDFRARAAQRRGRRDQPVGQQQLGRMERRARHPGLAETGHVDQHLVPFDSLQRAGQLLAAADLLGEAEPRLVAGPVGEILRPGQRPVDARRGDFEPIGLLDRVGGVEHLREPPRQPLAILEGELARVRPLGHHLQRRIALAADHRHPHEREALGFRLGLDQPGQFGDVRHALWSPVKNQSLPAPAPTRDRPQRLTMSRK
jgi:hypothetical protein